MNNYRKKESFDEIAGEETVAESPEPEDTQKTDPTRAAFEPAQFAPDTEYEGRDLLTTDLEEIPDEDLLDVAKAMQEKLVKATESVGELIQLATRWSKRLTQFDDVARLYESTRRDFDNYKRRNADLQTRAEEEGFCKAVKEVLPTLDNFERAVAMIADPAGAEGVKLIERQFRTALTKLGVEEIPALGAAFDPNFHNAVMQVETDEDEMSDKVVEVFQKGYLLGDKVLRYAQVKVAKKFS